MRIESFVLKHLHRDGYSECLQRLPKGVDGWSVRPGEWPIDEDRVALLTAAFAEALKPGKVLPRSR